MLKYIFLSLLIIAGIPAFSQQQDSLFAVRKGESWAIRYTLRQGETMPMLAHRFKVSEAALERANEPDYRKHMPAGTVVYVPVVLENYFVTKQPLDITNIKELYYHVVAKDDIGLISTTAGITKNEMREWNSLRGNTLKEGQVLFIGWVKMVAYDSTSPNNELSYVEAGRGISDTVKTPVPGALDSVYRSQTSNGSDVLTEKGTAVFFEKAGKSNIYYAFHNTTKRGTVIKVFNPGTNKTIYVKVLGPIPDTRLYAGSIIGITSAAKEALGITDSKAWCELSYTAN
jgi:LysM repeat protein